MTKLNKKTWIIIAVAAAVILMSLTAIFIILSNNKDDDPNTKVTVSFNSMGGDAIEPIQVERGTDLRTAELPQAQKEGVVFCAWYTDEALSTEYYDTDGIISSDTTLYAGYEEYQASESYAKAYDVGETSVNISPDSVIELLSPVELTNDNLYDYITVINELEVSLGAAPDLSVTKSDGKNTYRITPIGKWPEGGRFVLEGTAGIRFTVKDGIEEGAAVAAPKLTVLIDITEDRKNIAESESVIDIKSDDYLSFNQDALVIKASAVPSYGISEGALLKVLLKDGSHQYIKAGSCETAANGDLVISSEAALPGEVFSEFDIAANAEDTFLSDHFDSIDKQTVLTSLTSNPNFVILQDLAALSATDYVNRNGISNVGGVKLLSGKSVGDVSGVTPIAYVGNIDFIWETVAGPEILKLEKEYQLLRTGVSFDIVYDDDTFARITLELQTGSSYGLLIYGKSKKLIPVSDVWLNARLKADYVTVFKFNIVMHDGNNVYDASEEMNNFGSKDKSSLVAKYKELINLDTEKLKVIDEDIYAIPFNILDIIVLRVPFGLEVEIDLNGSFSTELINRVAHFYGINGSVGTQFDFWDAHCWQREYEKTSYYGRFDISIGVRSGVTVGLAGMDTLGRFGLKAEIGVYYQFLGYGYTESSYRSSNDGLGKDNEIIKEENISSSFTSSTRGAMYHELGLYLQFGVYVESEIFKVKAEAESPQIRIKLMEQGTLYEVNGKKAPLLPLGFSDAALEEAKSSLVVTEHGVQLESLPYYEIVYLNLKNGELVTRQVDFSNFRIKDCYILYHERTTNLLKPRRNLSNERIDSAISIKYVDDALYYIDDYLLKYYVTNGTASELKLSGAYTELKVPVTYLPPSLADYADKVNETMTVDFTADGTIVRSLEVKFGATVFTTLGSTGTSVSDYLMSSGADFTTDPNVSAVGIPTAMYNQPITENTSVEVEIYYFGVPISVRRITGIRESDGYKYYETQNGYIVWCNSKLTDSLAELATDPHENLKFVGWRDINTGKMITDNRTVTLSDSKTLSVEAVYEGAPITVTVNIDPLNDGTYTFDGATYTYSINAGEDILEKTVHDFGAKSMLGNWAMYITEYEKYADSFNVKFYENETVSISWFEMPTKYKITFDPNGGRFTAIGDQYLTDGVYVMDCADKFTFTSGTQEMLLPEKEDDIAAYKFIGWYYLGENGEKLFGISAAEEDRTYYAEWLKEEKYFSITLNAEGTLNGEKIVGEFVTGKSTYEYSLKYSEIQRLAEEIKNGIYDSILIPTAGLYVFDKWVLTSEYDGNYTFTASYAEGMVNVKILSEGPCGNATAEGKLEDGAVTSLQLTPSEWETMRARIDAFDYSELPSITPLSDAHIFSGWRVSKYSELEYEIMPIFVENKEITITISSVGDCNGTPVPGTLSGSGTIVLRQTEADAFVNKVYNANYSELPTVTPDSDEYIFISWQVSSPGNGVYLITPIYGRGAYATVTYELGRGSSGDGITGTKTYTLDITGDVLDFKIDESMKPAVRNSVNGYNENGKFTDYACYEDEHYYYVFSGWKTSDGKTSWSLKHKDSVTITAEYEKRPKAYSVEFTVDFSSAEKEIFIENGRPTSYGLIILWGAYGTKWSEYEIPTAIKQTSDDSTYTYEFVKWVSVDNGSELPEYVNDGERYKAVFEQVAKPAVPNSIKVTFDAGEDGYFLSTGERYKTVEYAYGTIYDDMADTLEKPIRNDSDYKFHDWIDWWYGDSLTEDIAVSCTYWNTERGCLEGEEDMIQLFFDAGEGAYFEANYNGAGLLVYPELDPRYFVHAWEENTLFYSGDEPSNSGDYTHAYDIAYFEQFVIVKDGKRYTAKWALPEQLIYTWDIDKTVITYTELIPFTE